MSKRIELKNGKSYHGFLNDSDDDLNIVLGGIKTMNASKGHQKEKEEKEKGTNNNTNRGSSQFCV